MQKKIILVLVEGFNDKTEIEKLLKADYFNLDKEKYLIVIRSLDFDISSDYKSTKKSIVQNLSNKFHHFRKEDPELRFVGFKDFYKIIQIVDLDGTFVRDENVVYEAGVEKPIYDEECIRTAHVGKIVARNQRKRENLKLLIERNNIEGIPYSVYYASCNMDHLLFNKANNTREEKARSKSTFIANDEYSNSIINEVFENNKISVQGDYIKTWKYVYKQNNSLQRKTNLQLFFNEFK